MRQSRKTDIIWFRTFGGVCQAPVGEHVPPELLRECSNYELNEYGELSPSKGTVKRISSASPDSTPVRSFFLADMDGDIRELVATDKHVYDITSGGWVALDTITSGSSKMRFALLNQSTNPVVVWGNGSMNLRKWDKITVTDCTDAPAGCPISYKNYLAVFNIKNLPGKVQFSTLPGRTDSWVTGGTQLYLESTGEVTSLYEFGGGLVVFGHNWAEFFPGDPQQPAPMTGLSTQIGCVAHETVADCSGVLVWLSKNGIEYWTGGGSFPSGRLSNPEVPRGGIPVSNIQDDIDSLDPASFKDACGAYWARRKTYIFSTKRLTDADPSMSWQFHFRYGAWFPRSIGFTALSSVTDNESKESIVGCTNEGKILDWAATNAPEDDGVEFDFYAQFGDFDMGYPDFDKIFRSFFIGTRGVGVRELDASATGDFGMTSTSTSVDCNSGGFILGVNVLGDALSTPRRYMEKRAPISLRTKHISPRFYGKGNSQSVAIAAWAIEYRLGVRRPFLVGSIRPSVNFIYTARDLNGTSHVLVGSVEFTNTSTNTSDVSGWAWSLDGTEQSTSGSSYTKTFTVAGTFEVKLTANGPWGSPEEKSSDVLVTVAPHIFSVVINDGTVGVPILADIILTPDTGYAPMVWTASDLPPGVTINADTGALTGSPTSAGTYHPVITVTDGVGETDSYNASVLTIASGTYGNVWSALTGIESKVTALCELSNGDVLLGTGDVISVYKTDLSLASFTKMDSAGVIDDESGFYVTDIRQDSSGVVWMTTNCVGTGHGVFYKSTDNGVTWSKEISVDSLWANVWNVFPLTNVNLFLDIGGGSGRIMYSTDSGSSFHFGYLYSSGLNHYFKHMGDLGDGTNFLINSTSTGSGTEIHKTDGHTGSVVLSLSDNSARCSKFIQLSGGDRLTAIGKKVYTGSSDGSTWAETYDYSTSELGSIEMVGDDVVCISTFGHADGYVHALRSTDSGVSFTEKASTLDGNRSYAMLVLSNKTILLGTNGGTTDLYKSES